MGGTPAVRARWTAHSQLCGRRVGAVRHGRARGAGQGRVEAVRLSPIFLLFFLLFSLVFVLLFILLFVLLFFLLFCFSPLLLFSFSPFSFLLFSFSPTSSPLSCSSSVSNDFPGSTLTRTHGGTRDKRSTCARRRRSAGSTGGTRSSWAAGRTRGTRHICGRVINSCKLYVAT